MSLPEDNVEDDFENFDIEIFIEHGEGTSSQFLEIMQEPKYDENVIIDGILSERDNSEEISRFKKNHENKKTSSEYFLIEVDEEIPERIMEKYFKKKKDAQSTLPQDPTSVYKDTLSGPFGEDC